ncbi:hypothetical protein AAVH_34142, partial [Aphelenchoides avenae]
ASLFIVAMVASAKTFPKCGPNEHIDKCGGCDGNCQNPRPICHMMCTFPACRCNVDHVRAANGSCVHVESCYESTTVETATEFSCPENEVIRKCGECDGTCSNQDPVCPMICASPACGCIDGYVRSDNGTCIPEEECGELGHASIYDTSSLGSTTGLPCGNNEELKPCGACDGTCSNRTPMCTMECREAECGCIAGYLRDSEDGHCVAVDECDTIGTSAPLICGENEEVKQCGACDGTCVDHGTVCTLECRRPECGCKDGFVRNDEGECVPKGSC